jgi:hypothetical protein
MIEPVEFTLEVTDAGILVCGMKSRRFQPVSERLWLEKVLRERDDNWAAILLG